MEQILNRPEIQSAVVPFTVALLSYLGLRKHTPAAWIWALFAAFLIAAGLINGATFTPLTGTRKIILLVLASLIVAALGPVVVQQARLQRSVSAALGIIAILLVFWAVVTRMEVTAIALFLVGGVALVLWLTWIFDRISDDPARLHGAGFSLLLGTGLSATAGASALLGQLALALSASSGAVLLGWVLTGKTGKSNQASGSISTLPYVLAPVLLGLAAVIFARLPWYALIPLASIPLVTRLLPGELESRFLRSVVSTLPGLLIALAVAFWIWQSGSSASGY